MHIHCIYHVLLDKLLCVNHLTHERLIYDEFFNFKKYINIHKTILILILI